MRQFSKLAGFSVYLMSSLFSFLEKQKRKKKAMCVYNHLTVLSDEGPLSLKKKCTGQFEQGSLLDRHNLPVSIEPVSAVLREKNKKKSLFSLMSEVICNAIVCLDAVSLGLCSSFLV